MKYNTPTSVPCRLVSCLVCEHGLPLPTPLPQAMIQLASLPLHSFNWIVYFTPPHIVYTSLIVDMHLDKNHRKSMYKGTNAVIGLNSHEVPSNITRPSTCVYTDTGPHFLCFQLVHVHSQFKSPVFRTSRITYHHVQSEVHCDVPFTASKGVCGRK